MDMRKMTMTAIAVAAVAASMAASCQAAAPSTAAEAIAAIAQAERSSKDVKATFSAEFDLSIAAGGEEAAFSAKAEGEAAASAAEGASAFDAKARAQVSAMGEETSFSAEALAFEEHGKTMSAIGTDDGSGDMEWEGSTADGSFLTEALAKAEAVDAGPFLEAISGEFELADDGASSGEVVLEATLDLDDLAALAEAAGEAGGEGAEAVAQAGEALSALGPAAGAFEADVRVTADAGDMLTKSVEIDLSGCDWGILAAAFLGDAQDAKVEARAAGAKFEFERGAEVPAAPKAALDAITEADATSAIGADGADGAAAAFGEALASAAGSLEGGI